MLTDCCVCCTNSVFVGCVHPCGHLVSSLTAPATGLYQLDVEFNGQKVCLKKQITAGALVSFDVEGLNENYYFTGRVSGPSGQLRVQVNGQAFDCLSFKTTAGCASDVSGFNLIP